jgi:hypothetical protein
MIIRMFNVEQDYPVVSDWWTAHKWPPVPAHALSSFGMVAEEETLPLCAAWLYITNSSFSLIEFAVSNPSAPLKLRAAGLELLLQRLIKEAIGFGSRQIFTSLQSKSLIRLYCKQGFQIGDTNMTNLIYKEPGT